MITRLLPDSFDWESAWLSAMENAGNVTLGHNPVLPSILQQCWGWPVLRIFFTREGKTIGLFSALKIGEQWVSLPHFDQGSLWWDETAFSGDAEAGATLWQATQQLMAGLSAYKDLKVINLEAEIGKTNKEDSKHPLSVNPDLFIRCTSKLAENAAEGKTISRLSLLAEIPVMEQLPAGPARKTRKALKNGLEVKTGGAELLNDFYRVYRGNIKRLGSFGLPLQFFSLLISNYRNGDARVVVCYHQGRAVGASIVLTFAKYAENLWFATEPDSNRLYPSYLLHYTMLNIAQASGCTYFSFGRSTSGSGVHRYKQQFGGDDLQLSYNHTKITQPSLLNPDLLHKLIRLIPTPFARQFDYRVSRLFY